MTDRGKSRRGLTAIEIGVIIAVIALVAVSIGLWLAARREEKRRMHFHTVTTALRAYLVDWNTFPPPLTELREPGRTSRTVSPHYPNWVRALTTPIAYLAPRNGIFDPYARTPDRHYRYMIYLYPDRTGKNYYKYCVLVGCGPDRDQDLPLLHMLQLTPTRQGGIWVAGLKHGPLVTSRIYDPTNGTRSDGDMIAIVAPPDGRAWSSPGE